MKHFTDYLEHRHVGPGSIALDNGPSGRGLIIASADGNVATASWEYDSITSALAAWMAWNPAKEAEPQGYTKKREAMVTP